MTKKEGIKILSDKYLIPEKENIIYKIAIFIKKKYNVKSGVNIFLKKNIPISAGLGGGSSNAAFTIRALSFLWDLSLTKSEMHTIAQNFGSDINFFLKGGLALGKGRGDVIEALDFYLEIKNILLVKPDFGISSKDAYSLWESKTRTDNSDKLRKFLETKNIKYCFNDLEEEIINNYPALKTIYKVFEENKIRCMLSGSGSTVIGFCKNRVQAQNLKEEFLNQNYWSYITKTKRRTKWKLQM